MSFTNPRPFTPRDRLVVYKTDVVLALANALVALGKSGADQPERVRYNIENARRNFEQWLVDRPERGWQQEAEQLESTANDTTPTAPPENAATQPQDAQPTEESAPPDAPE